MSHSVLRYASDDALAAQVATSWINRVDDARSASRPFRVALPGGRITRKVLAATAAEAAKRGVPLDQVDFFWGDERCVPPDHAESNLRLAQEALFGATAVPESRIHRILGEIDPGDAARKAESELRSHTGTQQGQQPVLDLILLGMGEDGHVASLFPGAPSDVTESLATYLAVTGPKPPPRRVTLTYAAILAAKEVWVLASGAGKEDALQKSLGGGGTPLARVIAGRSKTLVFTDIKLP